MARYNTDILIIGQGLAGSLLAFELWQSGVDFCVIDPGNGKSASKVAGGLYYPLAARKLKEVELSATLHNAMKATFLSAEKLFRSRFLFETDSMKLVSGDELSIWKAAGQGTLARVIRKIVPGSDLPGIRKGFHGVMISQSGYVDVAGFTEAAREWLMNHKLLISEEVNYSMIEASGPNIAVNGHTTARCLVFCEGAAATGNPWLAKDAIRMNKGELIEIEAQGLPQDVIVRGEVFVHPLGNNRYRVGSTYSHNFTDNEPSSEGLSELKEKLGRIIQVPYTLTGHYAGIRPTTRDRQPVVGPLPENRNMAVLNGFGSRGVLTGPWYAAQMRNWIVSGEATWPKISDIGRFYL
jgi:glycine oxidase